MFVPKPPSIPNIAYRGSARYLTPEDEPIIERNVSQLTYYGDSRTPILHTPSYTSCIDKVVYVDDTSIDGDITPFSPIPSIVTDYGIDENDKKEYPIILVDDDSIVEQKSYFVGNKTICCSIKGILQMRRMEKD